MDKSIKKRIINDKQIKKFSAYGLLKNLAFFKPYLLIFLMSKGISLFEIGFLYSIREIIIYIFEIPSGLIADYYGRKKELYLCFIFYIISFVVFFFTTSFMVSIIAMIFFGLGEAFRTGTHKAIILSYLEKHHLKAHKAFVYGRTRSFSLIGSGLNAIFYIALIMYLPSSNYIFLASIIPYIADFMLIYTYPDYLDKSHNNIKDKKLKTHFKNDLKIIFKNKNLRQILVNQGLFSAMVKSSKDLIQPSLKLLILSSGFLIISSINAENSVKITIGIAYFIINITSSFFSRNAYKLKQLGSSKHLMAISFLILTSIIFLIPISIKISSITLCFILFFILHIISDVRKPIYLDVIDDYMNKELRATVLSIESQITAILTVILAPIFGYIADLIIKL